MQTILIQGCRNGWIVRPFNPCSFPGVSEREECAVFNKIEDLQAALPDLLKTPTPGCSLPSIDKNELA